MSDRPHWVPVFVGLGSNLANPVRQLGTALNALAVLPDSRLTAVSSMYRNPPMGPVDQPDYVNAVAALLTQSAPTALLAALQLVERDMGRMASGEIRWGPRIIDLDILTYGSEVIDLPELRIPHPGISDRNFVLFPLLELAPELLIPGCGTVRNLARHSDRAALQVVKEQE